MIRVGDTVRWQDIWFPLEGNPGTIIRKGKVTEILLDGVEIEFWHGQHKKWETTHKLFSEVTVHEPEEEPIPNDEKNTWPRKLNRG